MELQIDLYQFVSKEEVSLISEARNTLESPTTLRPYFDYFEEQISYGKIRLGLAILEKEEKNI